MITLDIYVAEIGTVISVFDSVKIYRSDTEDGDYQEISTPATRISLIDGVVDYVFVDAAGTSANWYRSSYYSSHSFVESSLSDPVQGGKSPLYHRAIYPPEVSFTPEQEDIVSKIRNLIGDRQQLGYLNLETCDDVITNNPHIIDLDKKIWPVYICLSDVEKISRTDPYVDGYRYLTFSGEVDPSSSLEIFYAEFRFSDAEIYDAFDSAMVPPMLTTATVTSDHMILQAAIDLLEGENADDFVQEGAKIKEGDDNFDPSPGFKARNELIGRLRKRLNRLIDQYIFIGIDGVLVD